MMDNPMLARPYHDRVDTPAYEYYFDRNGSIDQFAQILKKHGYIVQKGSIRYVDI